jgi:hypothetical protein
MCQDIYTKELEDEQRNKVVLLQELSELTSVLKETTIDINSAVNIQNTVSTVYSLSHIHQLYYQFFIKATDGYAKVRRGESTRIRRAEKEGQR